MDKTSRISSLKLSLSKKYLVTDKNKPFFWLADTWWFGSTKRLKWPEPFKALTKDRKKKGFNVILIVIGYPPEVQINSDTAKNSGGAPFDEKGQINKKYFDEVDKKIKYLVESGLTPCIVGGWGYHIDIFGVEKIKLLWREIIKRYSKYPVVFCLCGEIDIFNSAYSNQGYKSKAVYAIKNTLGKLPDYIKGPMLNTKLKTEKFVNLEDSKRIDNRIKKWKEVAEYIKKTDKNNRLLTAHVSGKLSAELMLNNPDWLSINTIQSGHSKDVVPFMVRSVLKSSKMIINMEPWYEGILSNYNDYYQRLAFWLCILSGARGHSYGAHGIWQMAENDNFMKHWGNSDWKKAKDYPGAVQLGKSAKFLNNFEWWKLMSNFKIINPSWDSDNPMRPVTAEIKGKHIFIYFPDTHLRKNYSLMVSKNSPLYKVSWIDPRTMKEIGKGKLTGKKLSIPLNINNKDVLCILSQK